MKRLIALQKIVELGSFTKAAEKLGYTQSAVSQMIASLEEELSIKLLYRSRIGIRLTLEGEELYPFIQRTVLQYQAMQEKADEIKGLETGIIRIGTISSISCHWLPGLIKHFQELYPKVRFVLHQGDYTSIPEWVRTGEVDFGFVNPDAVIRTWKRNSSKKANCAPLFRPTTFWPITLQSHWRNCQRNRSCFSRKATSASHWRHSANSDWSPTSPCASTTTTRFCR